MYYNTTEKTPMKKPMKMKDGDDVKGKVKKRKEMMEKQEEARATAERNARKEAERNARKEMGRATLQGMGSGMMRLGGGVNTSKKSNPGSKSMYGLAGTKTTSQSNPPTESTYGLAASKKTKNKIVEAVDKMTLGAAKEVVKKKDNKKTVAQKISSAMKNDGKGKTKAGSKAKDKVNVKKKRRTDPVGTPPDYLKRGEGKMKGGEKGQDSKPRTKRRTDPTGNPAGVLKKIKNILSKDRSSKNRRASVVKNRMMYGGMVEKKMAMGGPVNGMMHPKIAKATKPCKSV